jgi:hypothetical protein
MELDLAGKLALLGSFLDNPVGRPGYLNGAVVRIDGGSTRSVN